MTPDLIIMLAVGVLGSSTIVALINWWKDRDTDAAQVESLSTTSLREALSAVRSELAAVRAELHEARAELKETKAALDEALIQLEKYRRLLVQEGHI
jgi:multidrug efflux pump subunit AcrA (membrane-fusion protein)